MKLQAKKFIQADLATQRKVQIDEGLKLASKVDVLRETVVKEEGNLDRFRKETVARVQAEIDEHIRTKDNLVREVATLRTQRIELQIPLDAEWNKLRESQAQFVKTQQAWGEKSDILKNRETQLERQEQEIENEKQRAEELRHRASEALAEADSTLANAREQAAEVRNKAQATLFAAEAKEQEVLLKEKDIENREFWIQREIQKQQTKEVELATREIQLKDRYATLERTIKRLQK